VPATRPNRFSAPKQGSWPPEGGVCGLIDERGSQRVADEGRVCTTLHARCCMLFGALRCVALACPISGGWASLPSHRRPATRCGASETLTGFANIVRFFIRAGLACPRRLIGGIRPMPNTTYPGSQAGTVPTCNDGRGIAKWR
jgi:hypothetical protein